jgi:pimeloyl-ACP methyl ester carboxylesterase
VRYLDFGGPAGAPAVVCVHGLGGSAVNWSALAPLLTERYRVLAPDLAGHGLTRSLGRGTAVLLERFIAAVPGGPVILMGNSMGGMISLLQAAAAHETVTRLVLLNPALPMAPARPDPLVTAMFALYATPVVNRLFMAGRRRQPPEALVARTLALCCVDPRRVPAHVVAEHVAVARERGGFTDTNQDFLASARSVMATVGRLGGLPYRRGIRSVTAPVLLVHGERDRLMPVAIARAAARANPSWSFVVLPDTGHVPQLEAPRETAAVVLDWLAGTARSETPRQSGSGNA